MTTPTAAVTTLKSAIKSAIDTAADAGRFALPITTDIADSAAAPPPSPDEPLAVQIALVAAGSLGRTTNKVLDQVLIDVNLTYRHPDGNQANLDECHLVSEAMRDLLSEFSGAGARVEQTLTQQALDPGKALQGVYESVVRLDLDQLRTLHAFEAVTVDPAPLLTITRAAVWNAIDNWPAFADVWTRKFDSMEDLEELALHDPGRSDLPAIAVTWGPTDAKWWTNIQQLWAQQLFVTFWLPADQQDLAEQRLLELTNAIYKSAPVETPNVSYIRRAVGRPPTANSPVTLEYVSLGRAQQFHAIRGQIALKLTGNLDPNA